MRRKLVPLAVAAALLSGACVQPEGAGEATGRTSVIAAFFPVAEAVERMGGDRVEVTNLTPAGTEPHDLELTTDALDALLDADVTFFLEGFQPALDDAIGKARGRAIDLLEGLRLRERRADAHGDEEEHAAAGEPEHALDPHVWLDPRLWGSVVGKVQDALVEADPDGGTDYEREAAAYIEELEALDASFERGLASCERDLIVTSHGAFGYLAARYGLHQESIAGVSPEAEPDPRHLAELTDLVEREDVTTVFTEELVSPEVAEALAREAKVKTDVLDPIESEPDGGYFGGMRRNLDRLREALDCG